MRNLKLFVIILFCFLIVQLCFAYDETPDDSRMRLAMQKKVDSWYDEGQTTNLTKISQHIKKILAGQQINEQLIYHLEWMDVYLKRRVKSVPNSSEQLSPAGFLKKYLSQVTSKLNENDKEVLANCMKRYDAVDAVAKRENFPTALVLATWRKESSCRVVNPENGDGLFQIVAHSYPATSVYQLKNLVWSGVSNQSGDFLGSGRLAKDFAMQTTGMFAGSGRVNFIQSGNILEEQVMDFIRFSREKWKWYDRLQLYDEIPVKLSYDTIDLLSLRKHAILYNSTAKGRHPENSFYANQNFGWDYEKKQDGLVVMVLRVVENIYNN